jgi:hypothetical protein
MVRITFGLFFFLVAGALPTSAQELEFDSLKKLPVAVNSVGEESLPLLGPGGGELFFTRSLYAGNYGGKFSGMDVWVSRVRSGTWENASNRSPLSINNEGHNALVGMSADGNTRYFVNARLNEKVNGIYVSRKINNYWTRPEFIFLPGIESHEFMGIYVSPDFDVILLSMEGADSHGQEDLYFSVRNSGGQWSEPKNMGSTLNTAGFEISPFLSADKKKLYFASNGRKGEGDADIYSSERLYNSWETWSVPVNLGKVVNSPKFDAYFSIYGDSVAYFASNRESEFADLYQVKVTRSRTVLGPGQRYLSRDEWERVLGANVSEMIAFPPGDTTLNPSQREFLFFIANKLQLQKDILIHLVITEEESTAPSSVRLHGIADALVAAGIDRKRIIIEQVLPARRSSGGNVQIRLIE